MSDRKLGVSELLRWIGDEHVELQNLATHMTAYKARSKRMGATITFTAPDEKAQSLCFDDGKYIGMVLWIERKDYVRVVAEFKAEQP